MTMKRFVCLLLAACLLTTLAACGAKKEAEKPAEPQPTPEEIRDWSREGYFKDENDNVISVTWADYMDEPGWYVDVMIGDIMTGWTLPQEGNSLRGDLNAWDEGAEPLLVTVSEEGENGLLLEFESGETYHFLPWDPPKATIFITVNTEGMGNIDYAEGEEPPEIDPEYPYQSAQINLGEPATYTLLAWPQSGSIFVKWTKDGEDYSTEPQITVLLDESADFAAVFEEDPDWQNPVMNFVGEYQCGRAHARVECFGFDEALITIDWSGSAWETARWTIIDKLDVDTLTIDYSGAMKQILTYDDAGEVINEEMVYGDGTGTIVFHYEDNTFTWHEDQSESGEDLTFEWAPVSVG